MNEIKIEPFWITILLEDKTELFLVANILYTQAKTLNHLQLLGIYQQPQTASYHINVQNWYKSIG